ncbi:RISC-loading complex subunit tarbp2 [Dermatophagoides farinae]|uniref:RISC-loading complex subunit tarbp2 n=1 Tax=Dermatophagoides farinae TaxID=6954 RepID=A0A922I638_DERFA|nr:RISC-loading complex subunit tarbp2 [Dermatophagoides farinae]
METPAAILNQLVIDNITDAEYTLLPCKGKLFQYRCEVKGHIEYGLGHSKKKAKQAAAKKMVIYILNDSKFTIAGNRDQIQSKLDQYDEFGASNELNEKKEATQIQQPSSNTISDLQILCSRKRWESPSYNEVETKGMPHNRVFVIECFIKEKNLFTNGSGKSKQKAKHNAASKMMAILKKRKNFDKSDEILDHHSNNDFLNNEEKDRLKAYNTFNFFAKITSDAEKMKKMKELIPNGNDFIQHFFAADKTVDSNKIEMLAANIAQIFDCKLVISCLPDKSSVGQYQYLAEFFATDESADTLPLITVWGADNDLIMARTKSVRYLILQIVFYLSINENFICHPDSSNNCYKMGLKINNNENRTTASPCAEKYARKRGMFCVRVQQHHHAQKNMRESVVCFANLSSSSSSTASGNSTDIMVSKHLSSRLPPPRRKEKTMDELIDKIKATEAASPPRAKPGRKSKSAAEEDTKEKKRLSLERNRAAAMRCRLKKKKENDELKNRVEKYEQQNQQLKLYFQRGQGQSLDELANKIIKSVNELYADMPEQSRERLARDRFYAALDERLVVALVNSSNLKTIEEIKALAKAIEINLPSKAKQSSSNPSFSGGNGNKQKRCHNCNRMGHIAADCRLKKNAAKNNSSELSSNKTSSSSSSSKTASNQTISKEIASICDESNRIIPRQFLRSKINRKTVYCLIDSGSKVSVFPSSWPIEKFGQSVLHTTNGSSMLVKGESIVKMNIDSCVIEHTVLIGNVTKPIAISSRKFQLRLLMT